MASYDQMLTHYRMLGEQAQAQTDAQIRAQREAAALQSQRDAELFAQQQAQLGQQATLQAQRDQQLAGYQSQQQILAGQIGSARDYQGFQQQGALAGQQYEFTMQRDQQQAGVRAQEQVRQASLQEQLSQAQLNQREQMDMRRMEAAGAEVDQKVRGGYLTAEEGANLQMQIRTGLNPLRDRAMEADRLRSVVQTQGIEQQNRQQAQLFHDRQAILALRPDQRVVHVPDGQGGTAAFQILANGEMQRLDLSQESRANLSANAGVAQAAQSIISSMGAETRAQGMYPLQQQSMEASIAQTRTGTAATQQQMNFNAEANPLRVDALRIANSGEVAQQQFLSQIRPHQINSAIANVESAWNQVDSEVQQYHARRQAIPLELKERQLRLQSMGSALRYRELAEPPVSRNGDFYQGIDGSWHPNQGPGLERDRSERRIQAQRATFTHLTESVGRSMANEAREAMLEPVASRPAWMRSDAAYSTELQRRVGVQAQAVNNLLNPQAPRTPRTDAHGAPGITPMNPERSDTPPPMPHNGNALPVGAPAVPAQVGLRPSSVGSGRVQSLHQIAVEAFNSAQSFDAGEPDSVLGEVSGAIARVTTARVLGQLVDVLARAANENRGLTIAERAWYEEYLRSVGNSNPELGRRLRLNP